MSRVERKQRNPSLPQPRESPSCRTLERKSAARAPDPAPSHKHRAYRRILMKLRLFRSIGASSRRCPISLTERLQSQQYDGLELKHAARGRLFSSIRRVRPAVVAPCLPFRSGGLQAKQHQQGGSP